MPKKKVGVNLEGGSYKDFKVKEMNANNMSFENNTFDVIVCNATLEHDKKFWKTLSEIKRVAKNGCLIIIGVPGYTQTHESYKGALRKLLRDIGQDLKLKMPLEALLNIKDFIKQNNRYSAALTYVIHNEPGDYYRFSKQSVDDIFLEECQDKTITEVMSPPRIIGKGIYKTRS